MTSLSAASATNSTHSAPDLLSESSDLTFKHICSFLHPTDVLHLGEVCKRFRTLTETNDVWIQFMTEPACNRLRSRQTDTKEPLPLRERTTVIVSKNNKTVECIQNRGDAQELYKNDESARRLFLGTPKELEWIKRALTKKCPRLFCTDNYARLIQLNILTLDDFPQNGWKCDLLSHEFFYNAEVFSLLCTLVTKNLITLQDWPTLYGVLTSVYIASTDLENPANKHVSLAIENYHALRKMGLTPEEIKGFKQLNFSLTHILNWFKKGYLTKVDFPTSNHPMITMSGPGHLLAPVSQEIQILLNNLLENKMLQNDDLLALTTYADFQTGFRQESEESLDKKLEDNKKDTVITDQKQALTSYCALKEIGLNALDLLSYIKYGKSLKPTICTRVIKWYHAGNLTLDDFKARWGYPDLARLTNLSEEIQEILSHFLSIKTLNRNDLLVIARQQAFFNNFNVNQYPKVIENNRKMLDVYIRLKALDLSAQEIQALGNWISIPSNTIQGIHSAASLYPASLKKQTIIKMLTSLIR